MFDNYFEELDPVKRKEILDSFDPDTLSDSDAAALAQLRSLFELRYEPNKKGEYNDRFIGALTKLTEVARNPGGRMAVKKNTNLVAEAVRTLCLDRGGEFSDDILYREMCQLISFYITICNDDTMYQSAFLGMGRMSGENIREKIRSDLNIFWETIEKYLGDLPDFDVFKRAIADTMNKKL